MPNTSRSTIFDQYPKIKELLKTVLISLREASLPVNAVSAWNLAIGFMKSKNAEILTDLNDPCIRQGVAPVIHLSTIRRLLYIELKWTIRRGIKDRQKSPSD